jgi:hypothetical protein
MYKFSAEKFADSIKDIPKSVICKEFTDKPRSDGFMYLYYSIFLPLVKRSQDKFTLDLDLFCTEDVEELYNYYSKIERDLSKTSSFLKLFAKCEPKAKLVRFL